MLRKRQCYDFMGKMIQWNIDGELDHIPKMLGLIDGGSISFADRDRARGLNHIMRDRKRELIYLRI